MRVALLDFGCDPSFLIIGHVCPDPSQISAGAALDRCAGNATAPAIGNTAMDVGKTAGSQAFGRSDHCGPPRHLAASAISVRFAAAAPRTNR
jgi:hypothetical protein